MRHYYNDAVKYFQENYKKKSGRALRCNARPLSAASGYLGPLSLEPGEAGDPREERQVRRRLRNRRCLPFDREDDVVVVLVDLVLEADKDHAWVTGVASRKRPALERGVALAVTRLENECPLDKWRNHLRLDRTVRPVEDEREVEQIADWRPREAVDVGESSDLVEQRNVVRARRKGEHPDAAAVDEPLVDLAGENVHHRPRRVPVLGRPERRGSPRPGAAALRQNGSGTQGRRGA